MRIARHSRLMTTLTLLAAILLLGGALMVLRQQVGAHSVSDITAAFTAIPVSAQFLAILFTALSYLVLCAYDVMALDYASASIPPRRAAAVSFLSYAVSQTVGWAVFTGSAVRYRFWSGWGLSNAQITQAISFVSVTFWLGILGVAGAALVVDPALVGGATSMGAGTLRLVGGATLTVVLGYLLLAASRGGRRFGRWQFPVPTLRQALVQLAISILDWGLAAAVLYVLLPGDAAVGFVAFCGVFALAQLAGLVSHLPGGVGVFDVLMVLFLRNSLGTSQVLGALLAFRLIYYVAPFGVAVVAWLAAELAHGREPLVRTVRVAWQRARRLAPEGCALLAVLGGCTLLLSSPLGFAPVDTVGFTGLSDQWFDASVWVRTLTGIALLAVAGGLRRRLDAAYFFAITMLGLGVLASIDSTGLTGYGTIVAGIAITLLPSRRLFQRKAALLSQPLGAPEIAAVVLATSSGIVAASLGLGQLDLLSGWWPGTSPDNAATVLGASAGAIAVLAVIGSSRLLRPASGTSRPTESELGRARRIQGQSPHTQAALALMGDKALLFSDNGAGYLMYAVLGRSWVAMGDPVGPPADQEELVVAFHRLAHRHGGRPVFYEVSKHYLSLYADADLVVHKIGEEARVPLTTFSMEGGRRSGLRRTVRQVEREGCSFRVLAPGDVDAAMPQLTRISDEWLAAKHCREKGFSMGRFDPAYVRRFPTAVVEQAGTIVAFATIWEGAPGTELGMDLMRHGAAAPAGVMDSLFVQLFRWGRERGYEWFNLGMAPLSGLGERAPAPLWHRAVNVVYTRGERFYNFQGVRRYKNKFDPEWSARYLASPGGLALPGIVADIARLIRAGRDRRAHAAGTMVASTERGTFSIPTVASPEELPH